MVDGRTMTDGSDKLIIVLCFHTVQNHFKDCSKAPFVKKLLLTLLLNFVNDLKCIFD